MMQATTTYAYEFLTWVIEEWLLDPNVYIVVSAANSSRYNSSGVNFTQHLDLCYDHSGLSEAFILTEEQYEQVI